MKQSQLFCKTTKNKTAGADSISHDLLVRAGYIDQLMAGVYSFLPLGFRVVKKIEAIIRRNMEAIDGQELLLPALHPKENWMKTGRFETLDILFKLKGAGDKEYALGSTHEEIVTPLAKKVIFSYRDLPLYVFQIQNKFRDELRAKSGILRTREFMMKDLYSFHTNQADLDAYYQIVTKAYEKIFKEVGIGKITYRTLASGGSFSKYSDEFQMETQAGEDIIYVCKKCSLAVNKEIKAESQECTNCSGMEFEEKKAVEVGNIFKLGTKFSAPFDLKFTDRDGQDKNVLMGCYGIGLGRLLGAIVEANHDDRGIIWPKSVAPFSVHLISLPGKKVMTTAKKIYQDLQKAGIDVLWDDRDKTAGEKFAESDLLGLPMRLVVSERTLAQKSVEMKERGREKSKLITITSVVKNVR